MPPKQQNNKFSGQRRQRDAEEDNNEFSNLPAVSGARFTDPHSHTITIALDVPSTQLGHQATFNMVAQKLLFQPSASLGIFTPKELEQKKREEEKKQQQQQKQQNEDQEEDDELPQIGKLASRSGATGNQQQLPNKLLPRRIITSIEEISNVKPLGTKPSVRGGELFTLAVTVRIQTINVLSDGFASAMVCRSQNNKPVNNAKYKKGNDDKVQEDSDNKDSIGLKLSFFLTNEKNKLIRKNTTVSEKTKKPKKLVVKDSSDDDDDDEEEKENNKNKKIEISDSDDDNDDTHTPEFFACTVPIDAAHLLASSTFDKSKFAGKKILVTIENNGTSWRAHLGLTPGSGGKGQSTGHWETHMPWTRSEKREQWNFRALPPSQRSNDNRVVIKFVKDKIAPKE